MKPIKVFCLVLVQMFAAIGCTTKSNKLPEANNSIPEAIAGCSVVETKVAISAEDDASRYLNAVIEFADNVLKYGRDTYGHKHTPLFVDGLNVHTHEPVKWIAPNGDRWILSNLASQQNLFRTLDGLTKITGDPKYKQAAMEAIKYAFENLRHPNGLLYWGLATAYDAATEEVCGDKRATSFKACYPYYELMWEANFKVTKQFIEALWSVHILDWRNLDMDRIAYFNEPLEKAWDYDYEGGAVFFKSRRGTSFDTTASDLYYASAFLYSVSGQKDPLIWSKRLAHRYVETRNPKTGIGATIYSVNPRRTPPAIDSSGNWVVEFWHFLGDPEIRDRLYGQLTVSPGLLTNLYGNLSICQLMLGEMLGDNGTEFKRWAHEELAARGRAAYRTESNQWIPMLTDGTNLEGVEGRVGRPMVACPADTIDFWSYALAFKVTGDKFMWEMSRNIAQGNGLGDIGFSSADEPRLLLQSDCLCPFAILGFLELYKATQREQFLEMGNRIGDNILANKFHKGFFLPTKNYIYAQFNAIEALVLLHLHSAGESEGVIPPQVWPSRVYFVGPYRGKESGIDQQEIYSLTETTEPPVSIGEAARMCDIKLIKLLITQGENIDKREERFFRTALHYATIEGHISIVELLLAEGANVNAEDYDNDTPLHDAAKRGHKQIAELLIAKGANVNAKNRDGQTPLHYTERGQKDIADLLIANGADINAKNNDGQTPLHYAVRMDRKEIATLLIGAGADVNAKNNDGQTPLDIAVSRNHKEIVELLIKNGADVSLHTAARFGDIAIVKSLIEKGACINAKDTQGRTALHYAAEHGRKDIAELLIARGADVNVEDKDGNTPGNVALGKRNRPTLNLLIAKGANFTSIHLSAYQGNLDEVRSFIAKGADVNAKDISGETPLHKAAIAGHKDVVGLLIDNAADVNAVEQRNCTPVHYAGWSDDIGTLELLIEKGADVNAKDRWGCAPLHYMAQDNYKDMVEFLIAKGADVNTEDNWGETPLEVANYKGHTEIVELLRKHGAKEDEARKEDQARQEEDSPVVPPEDINKKADTYQMPLHKAAAEVDLGRVKSLIIGGADVDAESNEGWTALHRAAVFGHADVVKFLLGHGADVNTVNSWGWMPLHSAALYGHKAVVALLLANGADISAKTPSGETPMQIAKGRGHAEIFELLRKHGAQE